MEVTMNSRLGYLCGKQNWRCYYCKRQMTKGRDDCRTIATIDEVHPRSKGGLRTLKNQVAACKACNNLKGSMSITEFQVVMARPEFWEKISQSNAVRRQAKKDRKEARRAARAEVDGRWSASRLPKPPMMLDGLFTATIGDFLSP
jgi:5-methylcytosine-specific restriction endonuclease McrA